MQSPLFPRYLVPPRSKYLFSSLFACCTMFPLETSPHPPGDPSGGVVYLRTVLSPEQGFRMWVFLNKVFYREGLFAPRPTPSWRTTPRRPSATAYSIYSQLPSLSEAVPLSATWGRAMPWRQGPTTWCIHVVQHYVTVLLFYFTLHYYCG